MNENIRDEISIISFPRSCVGMHRVGHKVSVPTEDHGNQKATFSGELTAEDETLMEEAVV